MHRLPKDSTQGEFFITMAVVFSPVLVDTFASLVAFTTPFAVVKLYGLVVDVAHLFSAWFISFSLTISKHEPLSMIHRRTVEQGSTGLSSSLMPSFRCKMRALHRALLAFFLDLA